MPTAPPPDNVNAPYQIPEGPFSQYLRPPAIQEVQQVSNQGPQPSGREGATGKIAYFLSQFMTGAAVGKARQAAQREMRQHELGNQFNQFQESLANSDKSPDEKAALSQAAVKLQGSMVLEQAKEAGNSNSLMKAFHAVGETLMGGSQDPTMTDANGKKVKVKYADPTEVKSKLDDLWSKFAQAPTAQQGYERAINNPPQDWANPASKDKPRSTQAQIQDVLQRLTEQSGGITPSISRVWRDPAGYQLLQFDRSQAQKFRQQPVIDSFQLPQPMTQEQERNNAVEDRLLGVVNSVAGQPAAGEVKPTAPPPGAPAPGQQATGQPATPGSQAPPNGNVFLQNKAPATAPPPTTTQTAPPPTADGQVPEYAGKTIPPDQLTGLITAANKKLGGVRIDDNYRFTDQEGNVWQTQALYVPNLGGKPAYVDLETGKQIDKNHPELIGDKSMVKEKPKEPKEPAAIEESIQAYRIAHPDWSDAKVRQQAANDILAQRNAQRKNVEEEVSRREQLLQEAKSKDEAASQQAAVLSDMGKSKYVAGGPSIANPKGDAAMDLMAWQFLTGNKMEYIGSRESSKDAKLQAMRRAGEIMADYGIAPGELYGIQSSLKANSSALSKITSMGALVNQFENTVEGNLKVAEKLSGQWDRTKFRAVNDIVHQIEVNAGGDAANNLYAQLNSIASEWAKVMSGSTGAGGVQIGNVDEARKVLATALSKGQLQSLFDNVIRKDLEVRRGAITEESQDIKTKLASGIGVNAPKPMKVGDGTKQDQQGQGASGNQRPPLSSFEK